MKRQRANKSKDNQKIQLSVAKNHTTPDSLMNVCGSTKTLRIYISGNRVSLLVYWQLKKNPIFTNKIERIYKTTYMQLAIICKLKIPQQPHAGARSYIFTLPGIFFITYREVFGYCNFLLYISYKTTFFSKHYSKFSQFLFDFKEISPTKVKTYVVFCEYFKIFFWSTDFKYSQFKHTHKL